METAEITDELRSKSTDFLKRLEDDLKKTTEEYEQLSEEIQEYVKLKSFLSKELDFGQVSDRNMMVNLGQNIYTKAKVKADQKIIVRLQADLFAEMPYNRADAFVAKRLELLNSVAENVSRKMAGIRGHITFVHAAIDPGNL